MTTANLEQTRFLKYSRTVGMTTMRGRGFYYPMDSAMAGDGRIYVVNRSSERSPADTVRVTMLNMEGEYFGVFGAMGDGDGEFRWPCGIALDGDGRVYVSDEHLHRITRLHRVGRLRLQLGHPQAVATGSSTARRASPSTPRTTYCCPMLVTTGSRGSQRTGSSYPTFGAAGGGDGELDLPWGLTTNADGDVFVADWGNDRVQKFSSDGDYLATIGRH